MKNESKLHTFRYQLVTSQSPPSPGPDSGPRLMR